MAEAKVGDEFITHEFDESISIQRAIVEAEQRLAKVHPHPGSKEAIAACLKDDRAFLDQLERLGKPKGATGKVEDVSEGVIELLDSLVEKADEAPSEAYEAHAVLLNAKRKQQDSAGGMLAIARAVKDTGMRDAAQAFAKAQQQGSDTLAERLAEFAVVIATAATTADAAASKTSRSSR